MSQLVKTEQLSLFEGIASLHDGKEVALFLEDLCTPQEIETMTDRWVAAQALQEGKPYRKIHEETGVSVTTVGRVARSLSYGHGGYQLILNRLKGKTSE